MCCALPRSVSRFGICKTLPELPGRTARHAGLLPNSRLTLHRPEAFHIPLRLLVISGVWVRFVTWVELAEDAVKRAVITLAWKPDATTDQVGSTDTPTGPMMPLDPSPSIDDLRRRYRWCDRPSSPAPSIAFQLVLISPCRQLSDRDGNSGHSGAFGSVHIDFGPTGVSLRKCDGSSCSYSCCRKVDPERPRLARSQGDPQAIRQRSVLNPQSPNREPQAGRYPWVPPPVPRLRSCLLRRSGAPYIVK